MQLHFVVRDTGVGIAPEKQKLIFDAFSQADGSTVREFGGTGLGLTISSRLVAIMGGRIWVESALGRGSSFHFTANLREASNKAERSALLPSHSASSNGRNLRKGTRPLNILLAEDNAINQKIACRFLERAGHRVTWTSNGQEALAALNRESFDLLLMDVQMPVMDGFEATAAIRSRERETSKHMPIIAITAHAMKGDQERCLAAGLDGYIAKPITSRALTDLLAKFFPI
jgi:CheY-like chemotaxis protein